MHALAVQRSVQLASLALLLLLGAARETLEQRIFRSFYAGDWAAAAALLEQYLAQRPNDPVMLYNAACAAAHLGERDKAAAFLMRSVKEGLRDFAKIADDPDLEGIRDHPTYQAIMERVRMSAAREADLALDGWRSIHGTERYRYEKDQKRHLAYATALDEESHGQMRRMLESLADHVVEAQLGAVPRSYVLIAVPSAEDASRFFDNDQVGGIYDHSRRTLVTRDIGASLRHEFIHALHYADMERRDQQHPLWVQEGLASLFEDYTLAGGTIVFLPNERHNIVKALAAAGRLTRWSELFSISSDRFMDRAGHLYPQVRSIFEFLADRGQLRGWYAALVKTCDRDPSGTLAIEECFGEPLREVEAAWRRWLQSRPPIDTTVELGEASLGIFGVPQGSNDGVIIERIIPGSAAAESALEAGDTIVEVDGTPTRSMAELQAVIAARQVGDMVRIRARRDGEYFTVSLRLQALRRM